MINLLKNIRIGYYRLLNFLKQNFKKEIELQDTLAQIIINSSNPEELKNKIVKEVAIALEAYRCFFVEYNTEINNFKKIANAFNTQRDALSMLGFEIEKNIPNLAMKRKYISSIIIEDTKKFILENNLKNTNEAKYFQHYNVQSTITLRLAFAEKLLGVLVIHYDKPRPDLIALNLSFLKKIAEQISIAIHLSTLYSEEKEKKEKEKLLRSIISIIGEGHDLAQITKKTSEILGTIYNVQSVFIKVETESYKNFYFYNLCGYKPEGEGNECQIETDDISIYENSYFDSVKNKTHYIEDTHNFILQHTLENTDIEKYFKENKIKSLIILPILIENSKAGFFIVHFNNPNPIKSDDLSFISSIVNQLSIAIKLAQDYEKEKEIADRETLLRKIIEKMRKSLDIEETLSFTCEEVVKLFNVQRIVLFVYPKNEDIDKAIRRKEYKISPTIPEIQNEEEFKKIYSSLWLAFEKGKNTIAFDSINSSNLPQETKEIYLNLGVKSLICSSIKKDEKIWGILTLSEYNEFRHWTDEEKKLLQTISDQLYIAINQAELYSQVKTKAKNERTLREIMLTSIRTFDLKIIINSIVTEAGKLFKADRCFYVEIDSETESNKPIKKYAEYLSSDDITSHINRLPSKAETEGFIQQTKQQQPIYANDISKENLPETTKKMLIDELAVKSYLCIPVFYRDTLYGAIVWHYVKDLKNFTQNEIDMAITIANQSAIVIHQAELYKITQKQAETERFNRKILEILRNTLDKETIKQLFVRNMGVYFKADRVFIADFDPKTGCFLPIDQKSEYLSGPDQKSFVEFDWADSSAVEYIQPLLEKRELKIPCWEEYINKNSKGDDFIQRFTDAKVKSSYSLPVIYEGRIMGYFCVEFTKESCKNLSDEDINRIRSMCTQAGIALFHAELYLTTQKALESKKTIIEKIEKPVNNILETSILLTENEFERSREINYLNNIINSCNQLLELTKKPSPD